MAGIPLMRVVLNHLRATGADAALTALIYGAMALHRRSLRWNDRMRLPEAALAALLGGILATVIERWALATGRWSYGTAMPVIPLLGVGLLPLLAFWYSARLCPAHAAGGAQGLEPRT